MAENIMEVFWMTELDKQELLYINPGYERIWGRTREEIYREPLTWMDAIHPDDQASCRRIRPANTSSSTMRVAGATR